VYSLGEKNWMDAALVFIDVAIGCNSNMIKEKNHENKRF